MSRLLPIVLVSKIFQYCSHPVADIIRDVKQKTLPEGDSDCSGWGWQHKLGLTFPDVDFRPEVLADYRDIWVCFWGWVDSGVDGSCVDEDGLFLEIGTASS